MTSQLSTIICVIFGVVSWYYFNKFMESEREYSRLHKSYDELHMENKKMKSRLKDLQSYKNDVSKTFKILDNESTYVFICNIQDKELKGNKNNSLINIVCKNKKLFKY